MIITYPHKVPRMTEWLNLGWRELVSLLGSMVHYLNFLSLHFLTNYTIILGHWERITWNNAYKTPSTILKHNKLPIKEVYSEHSYFFFFLIHFLVSIFTLYSFYLKLIAFFPSCFACGLCVLSIRNPSYSGKQGLIHHGSCHFRW